MSASSLEQLQQWMHQCLIQPESTEVDVAIRSLNSTQRLSGIEGLAIYQRSYHQRLLDCMRQQFPALCYLLGEQLLTDFAREYLATYPPESYTLYDLGRRFSLFLNETRPDKPPNEPEAWVDFMIDLSNYERQLFVLFDGPGHESKVFAKQDALDSELILQTSFSLAQYRFPVADYYHQVQAKKKPSIPPAQVTCLALLRKNYLTHTLPLAPQHHLFLSALQQGHGVQEAILLVAEHLNLDEDVVMQAWRSPDGIRQRWIDAGFFGVQ